MPDDKPPIELPAPSVELALGVVDLMLLTELQMRLGIDLDGSHTLDRARGLVGVSRQLDEIVRLRPAGDFGRTGALNSLDAYLGRAAPLITRIVRVATT